MVVPAAREALEDDGERFVVEHHHAAPLPPHRWRSDGTFTVGACVGTVCDGSPRQIEAVRDIVAVAREAGWRLHVVHAAQPAFPSGDDSVERRDAVLRLADGAPDVEVTVTPTWTYDALLAYADSSDVRVVVVPHLWMPETLLQVAINRRCRARGTRPPIVLGWRGPETATRLCEALEACA
jgi:hypothetical protein